MLCYAVINLANKGTKPISLTPANKVAEPQGAYAGDDNEEKA